MCLEVAFHGLQQGMRDRHSVIGGASPIGVRGYGRGDEHRACSEFLRWQHVTILVAREEASGEIEPIERGRALVQARLRFSAVARPSDVRVVRAGGGVEQW